MDGSRKTLDAKLPPMPAWVVHDLRRTACSLMAWAGVADHIAERTLGHAIPGVRGIYNRHGYMTEKAEALQRLAVLIGTILDDAQGNVMRLKKRGH